MRRSTFSLLLLLLLFLPSFLAWGPFTHVEFGGDSPLRPPASQQQISSFFAGCVSPDALKSVNMSLHSLRTAALMIMATTRPSLAPFSSSVDFDPLHFALGFGCHVAADFVGHHQNGYLTPAHDHPLELQVDAYFVQNAPHSNASSWRALLPISAASDLVQKSDPVSCSAGGVEAAFDKFQALLLGERAALPLMHDVIGRMSSYDVCGPTDAATDLKHLDLSRIWVSAACNTWFDAVTALLSKTLRPDEVDALVLSRVDALFAGHNDTVC